MAVSQPERKPPEGLLYRIYDSDIFYSFTQSPVTMLSALVTAIFFIAAGFAPWLAPFDTFDPATLDLWDAFTPPAWEEDGVPHFLLGTDDQGRDILSTIMYGSRVSLIVGFSAVAFSVVLGVGTGLLAGYLGGWTETIVMRLADVQLTIPAILVALMIDGVARSDGLKGSLKQSRRGSRRNISQQMVVPERRRPRMKIRTQSSRVSVSAAKASGGDGGCGPAGSAAGRRRCSPVRNPG